MAGGEPACRLLVQRFYARVAIGPVLRALYPEEDLSAATERLTLFLIQYWGGPATYSEQRGHPRLRMRHAPFLIDAAATSRWLACMRASLDEQALPPELDGLLWQYFETAAPAMINTVAPQA